MPCFPPISPAPDSDSGRRLVIPKTPSWSEFYPKDLSAKLHSAGGGAFEPATSSAGPRRVREARMVAKNTVFRLVARGDCGMYRYIVPFSVSANHSRALFGVMNSRIYST